MDSQYIFDQLALEFDLKSADYYLLDLIPLIEMMWLDFNTAIRRISFIGYFLKFIS